MVVFLGAGVGGTMRYWLSGAVYRVLPPDFPYGTLAVNVLGCFLIGFLMAILEDRFIASPTFRIFLTIGILGGFTTYSTFSFETIALLREGSFLSGGANILYTTANCLGATWLGTIIGKLI